MRLIRIILIILITVFFSCQKEGEDTVIKNQVPIIEKDENLLKLNPGKGLVFFGEEPFTGTSVGLYSDGKKKVTIDFVQGIKDGFYRKWFEGGLLSFESEYLKGKKHGVTKTWWRNGNIRSESYTENGVAHGKQMQWYKSGVKFKMINLVDGKEKGLQKSWRENGKIYNNYEAKDGRIFGLKRSTLCYELDDEVIKIEDKGIKPKSN